MRSCVLNFRLVRKPFFAYGFVVGGDDVSDVWLRREFTHPNLYKLPASTTHSRLFLGRTTFIFSLQHCHSAEPLSNFPFHHCPYFLFTGTTTTRLTALALKSVYFICSREGKDIGWTKRECWADRLNWTGLGIARTDGRTGGRMNGFWRAASLCFFCGIFFLSGWERARERGTGQKEDQDCMNCF